MSSHINQECHINSVNFENVVVHQNIFTAEAARRSRKKQQDGSPSSQKSMSQSPRMSIY